MGHATDKKQWSHTSTHASGLMECTITFTFTLGGGMVYAEGSVIDEK